MKSVKLRPYVLVPFSISGHLSLHEQYLHVYGYSKQDIRLRFPGYRIYEDTISLSLYELDSILKVAGLSAFTRGYISQILESHSTITWE